MSEILHLNLHREFFAAVLKTLLSANKRLNTAYVLKESFGQLWSYEREGWARRFFENCAPASSGSG
jgi:hypothetical protein